VETKAISSLYRCGIINLCWI